MKKNSIRQMLHLIGCTMLIAAAAMTITGCGSSKKQETEAKTEAAAEAKTEAVTETKTEAVTEAKTEAVTELKAEDAKVSFQVVVEDLDGKETTFDLTSDKETVGEALLDAGLIEGDDSQYGMFINTVNGVTLDWDKDQKYWSFLIDGEYAQTGVDMTKLTEGAVYTLKPES